MKKFEPKMSDGMGNKQGISPEAHAEWKDAEGKHDAMAINKMGVSAPVTPGKAAGAESVKADEAASVAKGSHAPDSQGLFKQAGEAGKSGFGPGPKKRAGKGAEGSIKNPAGAGFLNKGNGIKKGAGK